MCVYISISDSRNAYGDAACAESSACFGGENSRGHKSLSPQSFCPHKYYLIP